MDAEMMCNGVRAVVMRDHLDITNAALDMGVSRSVYQRIMSGQRVISPLEFRHFCEKRCVKMRDALAMGAERS